MAVKITPDEAYAQGRALAAQQAARGDVLQRMEADFRWARAGYLGLEDVDIAAALLEFSRERMASDLDLARYPECAGMREAVEAQRRGFLDVCNDPLALAVALDWYWFCSRRMNTRYVGKAPQPAQCTDFWFADTKEGGPIHGSNRDDVLFRYVNQNYHAKNQPGGKGSREQVFTKVTCVGGVSASVLCDDEPECLFPVNPGWVIPDGITDVREYVGYLEQYKDFWGPGNQLWVDPRLNFAAIEKANVRMGVRYSTGCAAITACAYLTPEMNAFKRERDIRSFIARGWSVEDNKDKAYWAGDEARYRRLLELVQREADKGATLIGAAEIALDHAVPFPARVCLSGEIGHPDEEPGMQNWTMLSFARCISGPNRRSYNWIIDPDNPKSIFTTPCHVIPGEGLEARKAEWEREVAAAGEIGVHLPE